MGHRFVENGGGNVSGLFIFVQMKSNNKKKSVIQFFFKKSISYWFHEKKFILLRAN